MIPSGNVDVTDPDHQRALGERLRRIRHQQGMSLADVEARSGGDWKAVVVGAYERGDRAVSLERLQRLAAFYGVPLVDLLPAPRARPGAGDRFRLVIDLTRLDQPETPAVAVVARYAQRVQRVRGDHNGRILTIRGGDLDMLAVAIGTSPRDLIEELRDRGALLDA